jgi:hypothetical protein
VGYSKDYPNLSWLDKTEERALEGIKKLVKDIRGVKSSE